MKCVFVSVWDDGSELRSDVELDEKTGQIDIISTPYYDAERGRLVREYLEDENGDEFATVCDCCHSCIMKSKMIDDGFHNFTEIQFCHDCDGE